MSDLSEAVRLYYQGKYEEALSALERSDPAYKVHYGFLELMGSVCAGLGDRRACQQYFEKALKVSPSPAAVWNNWGIAYEKMEDFQQAEACYQQAILADPDYAHAYHNRVMLFLKQENWQNAASVAESMQEKFPEYALGYLAAGNVHKQQGNVEKALRCYSLAIDKNPKILESYLNAFVIFAESGHYEQAASVCQEALQHHPQSEEVQLKLAFAYRKQNKLEEAAKLFLTLTDTYPHCTTAYEQLSSCYYQQGRYDLAIESIKRLMENNPLYQPAEIFVQLADCYFKQGDNHKAERLYEKARNLDPQSRMLQNNYAIFQAFRATEAATKPTVQFPEPASPSDKVGQYNQALLGLRTAQRREDFARLWKQYEFRFDATPPASPRTHSQQLPMWNGKPVSGKIWVTGEQGIGDQLFFLQMLSGVLHTEQACVFSLDPRLHPIGKRSFPSPHFTWKTHEAHSESECVAYIPLGSLCQYFAYPPFEWVTPGYCIPDPHATAFFQQKWKADREEQSAPRRRYIGFSWKTGNTETAVHRNIPLKEWVGFLQETAAQYDVTWVSLQHGAYTVEEKAILQQARVLYDCIPAFSRDIEWPLACVASLDGVITIDNSVAHFASALGKKTAVLSPTVLDWKWCLGDHPPYQSLWYPRTRVYASPQFETLFSQALSIL